jgi:hypothetical protein
MRRKLLLAVLAFAASLFAQGERGTLNGTVTDPSGAVVVGAAVKAINVATGVEFDVVTTDAGVFRMPYLQPGTYKLSASAPGFKSAVRENVILAVAQTLTLNFVLEVGAATEQVTVSSEAPLLETGTAEIGSYVSKKEFDTWPITVGLKCEAVPSAAKIPPSFSPGGSPDDARIVGIASVCVGLSVMRLLDASTNDIERMASKN